MNLYFDLLDLIAVFKVNIRTSDDSIVICLMFSNVKKRFMFFIFKSMKKREDLLIHSNSGVFLSFWIWNLVGVGVLVVVGVAVVVVEEGLKVKWCFSQGNTSMMSWLRIEERMLMQ